MPAAKDRRQGAEGFVHGCRVREDIHDLWVDDDHAGSSRQQAAVAPRTPGEKSYSGRMVSRSAGWAWVLGDVLFIRPERDRDPAEAGRDGHQRPSSPPPRRPRVCVHGESPSEGLIRSGNPQNCGDQPVARPAAAGSTATSRRPSKPWRTSSSALRRAPPAAPRTVLWTSATKRKSSTPQGRR